MSSTYNYLLWCLVKTYWQPTRDIVKTCWETPSQQGQTEISVEHNEGIMCDVQKTSSYTFLNYFYNSTQNCPSSPGELNLESSCYEATAQFPSIHNTTLCNYITANVNK